MASILIIKTAALGDVLRTTSILPGLVARHPGSRITWVTAHAAVPLVLRHPLVERVVSVDPGDEAGLVAVAQDLARTDWDLVLSLDDEASLCRLATTVDGARLSGAHVDADGRLAYTPDVAPWFDMGLLSVHGKEVADRLKRENTRTHPAIFADMLGIEPGRPDLPLSDAALLRARGFAQDAALDSNGPVVALNTGAGGRWKTKGLPAERVVELCRLLREAFAGRVTLVLFGGPAEAERNDRILADVRALDPTPRLVDGGCHNGLEDFAARVDLVDLIVTSDSLALHIAVARGVQVVAFFAPTSAAEIDLYGLGEKVASTAPDYCSYRVDADNESITAERLCAAVLRVLGPE